MLFHTKDRARWFLLPEERTLPDGDLELISFTRETRAVDPAVAAIHEVGPDEAKAWVDQRVEAGLGRAGEAFGRLTDRLRSAARARGQPLPDLAGRVSATDVLGRSPGDLYIDPSQGREAFEAALSWASDRIRPEGAPEVQRDPKELLGSLGAGLRAAAERIEAHVQQTKSQVQQAKDQRSRGQTAPKDRLQRVGFYRELRHGDPDGPSLREAHQPEAGPHEARVVRYLREAPVLIAAPGPVKDVLDPDRGYIGTPSVHTDGVWAWPGDLAAYIEGYHLALPPAFLEHLIARGFDLGDPDLTSVQF